MVYHHSTNNTIKIVHRTVTEKCIRLLKQFEGFKPKAYICPAGYKTIGYGHKLLAGECYFDISEIEAENLLISDLRNFETAVSRYIKAPLNNNQFDALVSFTYNLGPASLQRSTLRHKLNYLDYESAAEEFLKWIFIAGKKSTGLIVRRTIERSIFLESPKL